MPISETEFSYTMELDTKGVPESDKDDALNVAGMLILAQIKEYLDNQNTPVSKGSYKKGLSKEYKKRKQATGQPGIANLQLTDAMLNDLEVDATKSTITFKIDDSNQVKKAFNHNTGDTLPQRQFMPDDTKGEKFKANVLKEAKGAIETFKRSEEPEEEGFTPEESDALREFLEGLS